MLQFCCFANFPKISNHQNSKKINADIVYSDSGNEALFNMKKLCSKHSRSVIGKPWTYDDEMVKLSLTLKENCIEAYLLAYCTPVSLPYVESRRSESSLVILANEES